MENIEEILRKERRRKFVKRVVIYVLFIFITTFITPYIPLVVGLVLMVIGAFSMSPTVNLLRFRRRHIFSSVEFEEEEEEDIEEDVMNIPWKTSLMLFGIGFALFIMALILLSFDWKGIIFLIQS
ncbi:MAG: hypothetical protein J7L63_04815 [Thermoplasmata archaeon]|nr:hypothetical protein [Thermoplasmata archaeon]